MSFFSRSKREQPLKPSLTEALPLIEKTEASPEQALAQLQEVRKNLLQQSGWTTNDLLDAAFARAYGDLEGHMKDDHLSALIQSVTVTIKKVVETPGQLKTLMASTLISECLRSKKEGALITSEQINQKIAELFERFMPIIRSLNLLDLVNTEVKKLKFILDTETFPKDHTDFHRGDADRSFRDLLAKMNEMPSKSRVFAPDFEGKAGAGSSTEVSPSSSPGKR
mgnify:CR=1 FL=1